MPLFKLGIGKQVQMRIKKQIISPQLDDKYRGVNVSFPREAITDEIIVMKYDKPIKKIYFQSFGNSGNI